MASPRPRTRPRPTTVHVFGWPGWLGGASTKLAHLLKLLGRHLDLVVVPNDPAELQDAAWVRYIHRCGARCLAFEHLPRRLHGWGLVLCNFEFLTHPRWTEVRRRGLRMAWSNEMMWTHPAELGALTLGQIDCLLYVSAVQRQRLEPEYRRALTGTVAASPASPPAGAEERATSGWLPSALRHHPVPWRITGNYIDPADFPFRPRSPSNGRWHPLVVGRLSRPDPDKFPEDFPRFYEGLGLRTPRFRVMGWSEELSRRWAGHAFDERWDLLPPLAEAPARFLQSLDLFVYSLGPRFRESWGRAVVEAMLTGAVPLLPRGGGHHLEELIRHGEHGFLCADPGEFRDYARRLERDGALRVRLSRAARRWAETSLCSARDHLAAWLPVFTPGPKD